ncbi:cellulose biosynthesis cyclic di-GMP-binding regulatory protein BcsB [Limnobacter humi]|uniref:Cyclic di-GMP-binding protein n=1 Tax=Limnobacter humi TaxID=1778671 RepID=A0ABT1WD45_9BURK|nr:cellulose biosynthesis cyclic di-GMP-binding regulatory protein BcsB [Limnobacter humi]MCQ8895415.1 cellulose biosynthesis cyclic di-GMP-binding regulatory protein BcsB [Limnobacter humi]
MRPLLPIALFTVTAFAVSAQAQPVTLQPAATATAVINAAATLPPTAPAGSERTLTLANMGQPGGIKLTGVNKSIELNSGVRLDELVKRASLNLKMMYPSGMRHDQSFIRVYVNNQLAAISPLTESKAGVLHATRIDLDPTLFTDFSGIRIELDATYDTTCRDPNNPTLRVDIRPDSTLTLATDPLTLVDDLAVLPAPFFDPRDNRKLSLPLVLPSTIDANSLKAAGILASWMGAQAFYRQAEFEVLTAPDDSRHSVILNVTDRLPESLGGQALQGPTLAMGSTAEKPWVKQLYVLGRTDDELLQAVYGLVVEGQVLSGKVAVVKQVNLGAPRRAYDAPRYVATDRPVRFAELMDYPTQLEASVENPKVRLNLRLPPDLFSWAGRNVPMALKYRYTAPSKWNDSLLNVEINNALVQSFRLAPRSEQGQNRLNIDLLGQAELASETAFQIPAFRVGGNNELSFGFGFMPEGGSACVTQNQTARGAIDPESTVDFSELPHYTKMPNLTAFANGGYPFSIFADLSDSAVVLPQQPNSAEIRAYLNLMGLFGQWTGLPANRVAVITGDPKVSVGTKHWIALGRSDRLPWLAAQQMSLPMVLSDTERSLGLSPVLGWFDRIWSNREDMPPSEQTRALIQSGGSLGAIVGFESPWGSQKTGLVITGTDETGFERAVSAFGNYTDIAKVRGSVTLVRGEELQAYHIGKTFVSGNLPWWLRIRIAFSEHPVLIALGGALAGMALALIAYGWLSRRASRRIKGG